MAHGGTSCPTELNEPRQFSLLICRTLANGKSCDHLPFVGLHVGPGQPELGLQCMASNTEERWSNVMKKRPTNDSHPNELKQRTEIAAAAVGDQLLPAESVALVLGVSSRQVHNLVEAGILPAPIKLKTSARWRASDVRAVLHHTPSSPHTDRTDAEEENDEQ